MQMHNVMPDVVPYAAFLTDDPQAILRFAHDSIQAGSACALATLIEIRGGAAHELGAQMAIREDGAFCGFVSGGCTEAAVAAEALEVIGSGADRYVSLGEGSRFFDIQLPCGGGLTIYIHLLRGSHALAHVLQHLERRVGSALSLAPAKQTMTLGPNDDATRWHGEHFVRLYRPPVRMLVSGGSIEVAATNKVASAAGYEMMLWEPGLPDSAFDSNTAVVLLHHDLDHELKILPQALASDAFYIGALGSTTTHGRRCAALRALGIAESDIARIKAPIGIFPKARNSVSLALSVVGDVAAAFSAVSAERPRTRSGPPIHTSVTAV